MLDLIETFEADEETPCYAYLLPARGTFRPFADDAGEPDAEWIDYDARAN